MNFSLYACKQFLKDYIDNESNDYDVAFTPETIDVIASEMSRTNTQFTFEKVRTLIRKLKNTNRLDKPQENNKMAKHQTDSERGALFQFYVTSKWAHPSIDYDSLQTLQALIARCSRENYPFLEVRHIVQECVNADNAGELRHRTPKEVVVVEVERQPSQYEKDEAERKAKKEKFEKAHAAGLLNNSKHNRNELDDKFDHGKDRPLPLTEQQRVALNAKNERDNQIIADVQSRISNYTGATHSKTYAGRDALKATFIDAMNKGLGAEAVQKAVEAKLDSLAGNSSAR